MKWQIREREANGKKSILTIREREGDDKENIPNQRLSFSGTETPAQPCQGVVVVEEVIVRTQL